MSEIQSAGIIGAGAMGRGIAMALSGAGVSVRLVDTNVAVVDRALAAITGSYESSTSKGRLEAADARARRDRITASDDISAVGDVDLVVEAAFEDLAVKRAIFGRIDRVARHDAILATNTSYLDIDAIAAATGRPARVIGLHFFNPAQVMRLVEIIPGRATAADVVHSCRALVERLGKVGVVAGNCPGFIGNRMLRMYRREAQFLLEEGATPSEVDHALEQWGMAMGPFRAQDLAGLDIAMASRAIFDRLDPPGRRQPRVLDAVYARQRLGQKSGAGWYRYEGRIAQPDDEVVAIIEEASAAAGITRRRILPAEIIGRTAAALVDEGARILEEGHAASASDIDLVWVHGYGFPVSRGGPLRYADSIGLKTVYESLRAWRTAAGDTTPISGLLEKLAQSGASFAEYDQRSTARGATADSP